tara:strand:- start:93 stop:326 length:234 start_codon:yes stop_codon:yes gene_type:complete
MKLPELIDSLIELSCEDMPDEARRALDDAIDQIVSNMNNEELEGILEKGIMEDIEDVADEYDKILMKSILNKNLAFA